MRTQGFCWALRRIGRNKVDREKARVCHFGPYGEYCVNHVNDAKRRRTKLKSFGTQSSFTL